MWNYSKTPVWAKQKGGVVESHDRLLLICDVGKLIVDHPEKAATVKTQQNGDFL